MNSYEEYKQPLSDRELRFKQFQKATQAIGEDFEALGLSEEAMLASLEETREQVYQEKYAAHQPDEQSEG